MTSETISGIESDLLGLLDQEKSGATLLTTRSQATSGGGKGKPQPPQIPDGQGFAVDENSGVFTTSNLVVASDPNLGDVLTYAIVGGNESGIFAIDSASGALSVVDATQLDFESGIPSYSLTIQVTDDSKKLLSATNTITISVNDVNEAPLDLTLDATTLAENAAGAAVGNLTVGDPDAGDSHVFTVSDARFEVVAGQLKLKAGVSLDFEAEPAVTLQVTATDSGGLTVTRSFTVTVSNVNEAPTGIALNNALLAENAAGAVIGNLSVSDPDAGDSHVITVSDTRFEVVAGQLKLKAGVSLDFESEPAVTVQVTATDAAGLALTQDLLINVIDANEAPSAIALDNATVAENTDGAAVGTLSVGDPDDGDSHVFALSDARFEVVAGQLKLKDGVSLDFESEPAITLQVIATDSGGLTVSESFVLTVTDTNERPLANPATANTNEDAGIFSIDLLDGVITSDADPGDLLSITSVTQVLGVGGRDLGGAFAVTNGVLSFDSDLFANLASGESETVVFEYVVDDGSGAVNSSASNRVTVTVEGRDNAAAASPFTAVVSLADLDGSDGFRLDGQVSSERAGRSISSAGDVNGDGFDDLLIASYHEDAINAYESELGAVYVVFGKADGWTSDIDLASLDGTDGFRLDGPAVDTGSFFFNFARFEVSSAGDVNGDGFDDVIVGGFFDDDRNGASFVIFGKADGWTAEVSIDSLDGTNGFRLEGVAPYDYAGFAVSSAGDINGDGFDDLIVGAPDADPNAVHRAGSAYVIFGKADGAWAPSMSLADLDGTNGFRMDGTNVYDWLGTSVSDAGDVNGDGFDDFIVADSPVTQVGTDGLGSAFVIFGKSEAWDPVFDLSTLDGTNGFRLDAVNPSGEPPLIVSSAGDLNGDGIDDLVIGASGDSPNGDVIAGSTYVIFGKTGAWDPVITLDTLDGTNGFRLDGGGSSYALSGYSVSSAGDVNGDGFDDLIVDVPRAEYGGINSGSTYILYGKAGAWDPTMNLSSLDGTNGFRIDRPDEFGFPDGRATAAGDVNGDGFDDIFVSKGGADPDGVYNAGSSYVLFGGDFTTSVTQLGTSGADALTGTAAAESLVGAQGADSLIGGGGADVLKGGEGDDTILVPDLMFDRVDGDSGFDTLALEGAGLALDLTAIGSSVIQGIEAVDLTGSGDNSLTLDINDLLQLSDSSNELFVKGDAGDEVNLAGTWVAGGTATVNGTLYNVFTADGVTATLNVDSDIAALMV
jgi:hypothetical protein